MADVLTTEDARAFWDARHRSRDDLTSGGDVSFDRASNELFYALRLGLLLQVLGDATNPVERLRLLDAGCGKGWFSRALGRFGYAVHGIDVSPVAIGFCRSESATERYTVSPLRTWSPGGLYDVVVSIDVLFHLLDDGEWSESLLNLASLVRLAGRLVVSDWDVDREQLFGRHQRCRSPQAYRALLDGRGLHYDGFTPYGFRGSRVGFHAWTRVG
jgi:2-polyprenyl-3-methyl-5-hydroxy-6-metoxy-1,4-benzoquinol methylase